MEVFLYNLPSHLTDRALRTQLNAYLGTQGINDWSCHKVKKKNYGTITFLYRNQGEWFLQVYGSKSKLTILGRSIDCKLSNRGPPDEFLLKSLLKSAKDRELTKSLPPSSRAPKITFQSQTFSCVDWQGLGGYAKFAKRAVIIEFPCGPSRSGTYRVEIPYRIIEALDISTRPPALTFTLWEAPRFYLVESQDMIAALIALALTHQPQPQRTPKRRLVEILGLGLAYRLSVTSLDFHEMVRRLKERDILTIHYSDIAISSLGYRRDLVTGMKLLNQEIRKSAHILPFTLLFQMKALVKNGFLLPWVVQSLLERMTELAAKHKQPHAKASNSDDEAKLFSQIPFPGPEVQASAFDPEEIWTYLLRNEKDIRLGHGNMLLTAKGRQRLVEIHRATITPTGIALHGPDLEAKNRILRRFPDHSEYFMRVQFSEEDGTDLQFNSNLSNEEVYDRFKTVFREGISVAGRVHSAWFMAPFFYEGKLQTYFSVISYLGKFDHIQSPARCAARIGQAFSETPVAISLEANNTQVYRLDDVKSPDGSRVFSDGVGTISTTFVKAIHAVLPRRKLQDGPTCFQIRWGGAKGMLALDARLGTASILCVRPSMQKFESNDTANLEICDMANHPIRMVLNRQMIKILEDMGVSPVWFLEQQEKTLLSLQLTTAHIANTIAFLEHHNVATRARLPKLIRWLDDIRIDYRKDPFLSSVVEAAVLREIRLLKHKARIPISHGVTLFGIIDETGYLAEGQIYITFDDAHFISTNYTMLNNTRMIVTRSPALHPGDIQLVTNVVPPREHPLRQLRNCIVFSQKGSRDLPSCLSGGDLDGDVYNIIWDPAAVSQCTHVWEPADYPRVPPVDIGRTVTREDMSNFFIQFMATDQLGLIAVKHMILADQRPSGTLDSDCLLLANMHSTGVDYSKTGIPVDMNLLKKIRSNKYRPDFLAPVPPAHIVDRTQIQLDELLAPSPDDEEDDDDADGPNHLYYYSEKINGVLYRAIDERKIWYDNIKIPVDHSHGICVDLLHYIKSQCGPDIHNIHSPAWIDAKKEAWDIRRAYEDAIWNATIEFSDHAARRITELEVFTGALFNRSGVQTRRQRDRSIKLKDEFDSIAHWAESMIRKRNIKSAADENYLEDAVVQPGAGNCVEALRLSIACLQVGIMKDEDRVGFGRTDEEFQSFKFVAASCALHELQTSPDRLIYDRVSLA
ncbi:RdRP-domain-containing protein [Westerdykella ornata]|uniref:RNA-dependent RNA polymerase n=1 Tax=Westerdykella ornata TaxID=318751 RepID=A0A6A6J7S8_WESOR|nr:RdRP-domain-containing protein [Westerdykella ornata]KAF2271259.1 RdRP-domain-containing protein [Westerdykella ornata]